MDRHTFLGNVRKAALAGRRYRVRHQSSPDNVGYVGAAGDLCDALVAEVLAIGGFPHVVRSASEAQDVLREILNQYDSQSALCWQHDVLDELGVKGLLSDRGTVINSLETLRVLDERSIRTRVMQADIGISSVDYAVAESGTLVLFSRAGQERVASLLPPVHVALVQQRQIVPDLLDVVARLDVLARDGLPSNVVLITGPSKTGDIELELTTGVHGPGKWHVIIVKSESTSAAP